jgi:hypothetical protein
MKTIVRAAVGAVIAGVAAPLLIQLAVGTANANPGLAADSDQVTAQEPPSSQQTSQPKMKKEWIRSDGTSVFF